MTRQTYAVLSKMASRFPPGLFSVGWWHCSVWISRLKLETAAEQVIFESAIQYLTKSLNQAGMKVCAESVEKLRLHARREFDTVLVDQLTGLEFPNLPTPIGNAGPWLGEITGMKWHFDLGRRDAAFTPTLDALWESFGNDDDSKRALRSGALCAFTVFAGSQDFGKELIPVLLKSFEELGLPAVRGRRRVAPAAALRSKVGTTIRFYLRARTLIPTDLKICKLLKKNSLTQAQIAYALNLRKDTIKSALKRLRDGGLIRNIRGMGYELTGKKLP